VRARPLAIAEDVRQLENPRQAGGQQLLHGEFWRRVEIERAAIGLIGRHELSPESHEMRFEPRARRGD